MAAGIPENVGGWSYERTLGSGGFGSVYLYRNEVCSVFTSFLYVHLTQQSPHVPPTLSSLSCLPFWSPFLHFLSPAMQF